MAHYKRVKYPALMLFSLCMLLEAFGATTVSTSLSSLEEEKGQVQSKRPRIEIPATASSLVIENAALPTRKDLYEGLQRKARVLISELPKAKPALERIERELITKIQSIQSTNFRRATELAGLASSVKMLKSTIHNTVILAARDCARDDNVLGLVAITVIGSGALKNDLIKFSSLLGDKEDTQNIDCSVLMDVSASIHEITKDIVDPFQER